MADTPDDKGAPPAEEKEAVAPSDGPEQAAGAAGPPVADAAAADTAAEAAAEAAAVLSADEGMSGEEADQLLSQSEINALLAAVSEGRVETGGDFDFLTEELDDPDVLDYDLTSQDRVIRGRMPALDMIDDRFCRLFRASLASSLRLVAQVSVESSNVMKFGEFLNYLPIPACLNLVRLPPLRGTSLIALEAKLVFDLLDTLFGGGQSGIESHEEGREFTGIELMVVRRFVDAILNDLAEAWKPVVAISPEYVRTEINPQFVAVVAPQDVVIQTTYDLEIEGKRGTIHLIIPYSSIEPYKASLASGMISESQGVDAEWQRSLVEQLEQSFVSIRALLGRSQVDIRSLLSLGVGDIVELDRRPGTSVSVEIEGRPRIEGRPISRGSHLAIEVERMLRSPLRRRPLETNEALTALETGGTEEAAVNTGGEQR